MKALVKENTRGVYIGNSAMRAPRIKEGDTYTSPPGILDQCVAQAVKTEDTSKNTGQKE